MKPLIPTNICNKTKIFHITNINNLEMILKHGCIYAKNNIPNQCNTISIASEEVQSKRATKLVPNTNTTLHDYVPFYFAPRSPMLRANHMRTIENAASQEDIIYIVTYAQTVLNDAIPFIFSDRHAVLGHAAFYNDLNDLSKIEWDLFFEPPLIGGYSEIWQARSDNPRWIVRKEIRQAEFLVLNKLPWKTVRGIATISNNQKEAVTAILSSLNVQSTVVVKPEWYY